MSIAGSRFDSPLRWFTSSYSNGAGGECVECALTGNGVFVRDSKGGEKPVIFVEMRGWETFVHALNQGNLEG
ncbi:DUF397 domain-containing protein [Streptomyces sp. NBC_00280]|uniref:DUF397 domain-containing protein n=1 Tax=Streptomyces sp. NBC_00280 TaxID=2975699 RepID=UPI0032551BE8